MKRNAKAMVTSVLGLVALVALGYWALPQFQGSWPIVIVIACMLICPLAMLLMMRGMRSDPDKPDHPD